MKSKCSDTPSLNSDLDFLLGQSQIQVKTCTGLVGLPKHENENHITQEFFPLMDALVYVDIDQGKIKLFI